jgi:fructosamine-3-kinase
MLLLFGAPHPAVLAAYIEQRPLAEGWRDRVPLHQLHPLLVHAVLFGASYGRQAAAVARHYAGPGRSMTAN